MKKNQKSKYSIATVVRASPILLKELFRGNFPLLKYYLKNAMADRLKFKYPEQDMENFFNKLPSANCVGNRYLEIKDKIAIMTFDDCYDKEIYDYEKTIGTKSTLFLLSYEADNKIDNLDLDVQIHFDMRYSSIGKQINKIRELTGKEPIINRNHTLWWKHNHHDLIYLALNGIKVDSTLSGTKPFRLCVQGKLLPIWEVPFNVCDSESVLSAPYNLTGSMESLFAKGITPVVGVFHPHLKHKSKWKDFYKYADKHNYRLMTMVEFYEKYLREK